MKRKKKGIVDQPKAKDRFSEGMVEARPCGSGFLAAQSGTAI